MSTGDIYSDAKHAEAEAAAREGNMDALSQKAKEWADLVFSQGTRSEEQSEETPLRDFFAEVSSMSQANQKRVLKQEIALTEEEKRAALRPVKERYVDEEERNRILAEMLEGPVSPEEVKDVVLDTPGVVTRAVNEAEKRGEELPEEAQRQVIDQTSAELATVRSNISEQLAKTELNQKVTLKMEALRFALDAEGAVYDTLRNEEVPNDTVRTIEQNLSTGVQNFLQEHQARLSQKTPEVLNQTEEMVGFPKGIEQSEQKRLAQKAERDFKGLLDSGKRAVAEAYEKHDIKTDYPKGERDLRFERMIQLQEGEKGRLTSVAQMSWDTYYDLSISMGEAYTMMQNNQRLLEMTRAMSAEEYQVLNTIYNLDDGSVKDTNYSPEIIAQLGWDELKRRDEKEYEAKIQKFSLRFTGKRMEMNLFLINQTEISKLYPESVREEFTQAIDFADGLLLSATTARDAVRLSPEEIRGEKEVSQERIQRINESLANVRGMEQSLIDVVSQSAKNPLGLTMLLESRLRELQRVDQEIADSLLTAQVQSQRQFAENQYVQTAEAAGVQPSNDTARTFGLDQASQVYDQYTSPGLSYDNMWEEAFGAGKTLELPGFHEEGATFGEEPTEELPGFDRQMALKQAEMIVRRQREANARPDELRALDQQANEKQLKLSSLLGEKENMERESNIADVARMKGELDNLLGRLGYKDPAKKAFTLGYFQTMKNRKALRRGLATLSTGSMDVIGALRNYQAEDGSPLLREETYNKIDNVQLDNAVFDELMTASQKMDAQTKPLRELNERIAVAKDEYDTAHNAVLIKEVELSI